MTISPEAKEAAELELLAYDHPSIYDTHERGHYVQLAINSTTAPLQKEIERLRGEVEKAVEVLTEIAQEHHTTFREIGDIGYSDGLYLKPDLFKKVKSVLDNSRAKRVAEGKE